MKVFISWSGTRSQEVAIALRELLRGSIQAIDPWISSEDIAKGGKWFSEIKDQLDTATLGIVCLTAENRDSTWISFEAGAISKSVGRSLVCPFLLDLKPADVQGPLAQFQATTPDKEECKKLLRSVNAAIGEKKLDENLLEKYFERAWPEFESEIKRIKDSSTPTTKPPGRTDREILEEVLNLVRRLPERVAVGQQPWLPSDVYSAILGEQAAFLHRPASPGPEKYGRVTLVGSDEPKPEGRHVLTELHPESDSPAYGERERLREELRRRRRVFEEKSASPPPAAEWKKKDTE